MPEAAFEDFLTSFKTSSSATEDSATRALETLNLEEGDISDDYDFMDDADGHGAGHRPTRNATSQSGQKKYMDILQKVADRQMSEICIDLDDVAEVKLPRQRAGFIELTFSSMRGILARHNR